MSTTCGYSIVHCTHNCKFVLAGINTYIVFFRTGNRFMLEVEMVFDLSEALEMIAENNRKVFVSLKTFVFIIDKSNIRLENFGKAIVIMK